MAISYSNGPGGHHHRGDDRQGVGQRQGPEEGPGQSLEQEHRHGRGDDDQRRRDDRGAHLQGGAQHHRGRRRRAGAAAGPAVLAQAAQPYGYARPVFPRVMLARMAPGGVIHPHIDANPAAKWPHKIHVPLSTNPGVVSFFGGEPHHFPKGAAVEVNNLGPHWVRNQGATDRVHLIFEVFDLDQPGPAR